MKKQLLIIGITLVLLAVGLSGCTDDKTGSSTTNKNTGTNGDTGTNAGTGTDEEAIIGQWRGPSSMISGSYVFNFYTNGSCKISHKGSSSWSTYSISPAEMWDGTDGIITLNEFFNGTANYEFKDNDNSFIFTTSYGERFALSRE